MDRGISLVTIQHMQGKQAKGLVSKPKQHCHMHKMDSDKVDCV